MDSLWPPKCPVRGMTISPLTSAVQNYLPSIPGAGNANSGTAAGGLSRLGLPSIGMPRDQGGLSPFARMLSTLQQLQQTNPAEYQQVTKQVSTNLGKAAQQAQSRGNTAAANQLNKLARDFRQAGGSNSLSGQATSAFLSSLTQSSALNPATIIMDTISGAGASGSIY